MDESLHIMQSLEVVFDLICGVVQIVTLYCKTKQMAGSILIVRDNLFGGKTKNVVDHCG